MSAPTSETLGSGGRPEGSPLSVGVVLWLASDLMIFAGFFAAYFTLRAAADRWPPAYADLDAVGPAVFVLVLAASAVATSRARTAAVAGRNSEARAWLWSAMLGGAVFVVGTAVQLHDLGFGIDTDAYGSIYWITVGIHWLHVLGGLALVGAVLTLTAGDTRIPLDTTVAVVGYVWWFLVGLSVAVFVTFYVIR